MTLDKRELEKKVIDLNNPLLKLLFENGTDGVFLLDLEGNFIKVNPAFGNMIGYRIDSLIGATFKPIIAEEDYDKAWNNFLDAKEGNSNFYDLTLIDRDNNKVHVQAQKHPLILDGEIVGVYGIIQDSEQSGYISRLKNYYKEHDSITKLPNLSKFIKIISNKIYEQKTSNIVALLVDIDQFEMVNETFGPLVGEQLIREVSLKIKDLMGKYDIGRAGNDQFIILLEDMVKRDEIVEITQQLQQWIKGPYRLSGHEYVLTSNIGIAIFPKNGDKPETLIKHAMLALQEAKKVDAMDCYYFFSEGMSDARFERFLIESKLKTALQNHEFVLHYQPRIHIKTNEVCSMEALLRWEHPILGKMPPADFIPIMEENGLIVPIGEWVLKTACRQNKEWQEQGLGYYRISVNVSPKQLRQANFIQVITNILMETDLEPKWLELEITESAFMHNEENTIRILKQLKEIGIKIAIDDFGTGYSSLSYMKHYPVDVLKIDKSFIDDITDDAQEHLIAKAIISLGLNLGMNVVAEGVELPAQFFFLKTLNCTEAQGFLFSKPLPKDEFKKFIMKNNE